MAFCEFLDFQAGLDDFDSPWADPESEFVYLDCIN